MRRATIWAAFDDKITGIQQVMQNTVEKRQEALEKF